MRRKDQLGFQTRGSFAARTRRWKSIIYWAAYLLAVFTLFEVYSSLAARPELSPFYWLKPHDHPHILRPGQYRGTNTHDPIFEAHNEDTEEVDDMGNLHDRRNEQFYLGGTLNLTSALPPDPHPIPLIFDPYPAYNTRKWKKQHYGRFTPCMGPRGRDLDRTKTEDMMLVYKGKQLGFPEPVFGSYEAIGLDGEVCTDRYSRYGAYGHDEESEEDIPGFDRPPMVNWQEVDWYELQADCVARNAERYRSSSVLNETQERPLSFELKQSPRKSVGENPGSTTQKRHHARSAVLVRAWNNMLWTNDFREYLRALIMELSLHSGGEYEVFLLVHVKDDQLPIFSDRKTIEELRDSVPIEFRNIALFFNNKLLEAWYPKIEEHSPMLQQHQPIQIFSQLYPNFDYYWQLEMDGRHTGHIYHFFDKAISFAKQQPRKYLWERNAHFYLPAVHGSWRNFTEFVHNSLPNSENSTWGAPYGTGIRPMGPEPPVEHPDNDSFTWGVGEEADYITFLPIFDPKGTKWTFPDLVWNFKFGLDTPRRASIITMGRYSRRLLDLIHHAQATRGLGLASEMTGSSWCLFHGLKAVAIPQPIWADGKWTPLELNRIFNRGPPENNNGLEDSIWNWDHRFDHILYRLSYMFTSHTGRDLYRRWLGYRTAENEGGRRQVRLYTSVAILISSNY
ncbi:hypothetical protein N7470_004607 [Penicillium chermesinum]|nr:hypothetical protein N7470_004607 [Penicillium chermesinum]